MGNNTKKTVLVTGASKNSIGDALVREFLRRGLAVIATARSIDKIQHLEVLGARIYKLDTTSTSSIGALSTELTHLDILFNNAGVNHLATLADTSMADFRRQFDVNVFGTVELTQALLPLLIESKGTIVNHTSQSPYGFPSMSGAYAASKAALANYTDVLRIELKPFDINVMELVTGGAMSNITSDMKPPNIPDGSLYTPIAAEMIASTNPETIRKMVMDGDKFAKKVVGDVLNPWGPPKWTWRGSLGTTLWFIWILKCMWKGLFDGIIARTFGIHLLKGRMEAQNVKKLR